MVEDSDEIAGEAYELCDDPHLNRLNPEKDVEGEMKQEWVEGQEKAVRSHSLLFEGNYQAQNGVGLYHNQKVNWILKKYEGWVDEVGLTQVPLFN